MKQVGLEYKKQMVCSLCDKGNEGQAISVTLPIISGGLVAEVVVKVYICEACWSKAFKEFRRET